MGAFAIVKFGAKVATAIGTGVVAGAAIATVPIPAAGLVLGGCIKMGIFALEGVAIKHTVAYTDELFEDAREFAKGIKLVHEEIIEIKDIRFKA
jgi:ribosome-associated protein YbcJ (S4-like RNA binding protein)